MINDYTTPIAVDFNLGIPDEYNLISTVGETNSGNNTANVSVQWPEFDLWTTTTFLTGDESTTPGTYSASGTATFRIEFGNNGPARDNIILMNNFNSDQFISYTGDRDYGLFITGATATHDWNLFNFTENFWWQWYRKNISLWANETGYIDITYHMHPCGAKGDESRISIIDNYKTSLQFLRPREDSYISTRARDTNDMNNISNSASIASDGTCGWSDYYNDSIIGKITHDATWDLLPGQLITFTVPWTYYDSNLNSQSNYTKLSLTFSPRLSFVWLLTGSINSNGDSITENISKKTTEIAKKTILSYWNDKNILLNGYTWSRENLRVSWLSWVAQNECKFDNFPTGRSDFDNATLELFQYQEAMSGFESKLYTKQFDHYQWLWYNKIQAHLSAFVDTQTAIYEYSYLHDGRDAMRDRYNVLLECEGQYRYRNDIQWGINTGQAEINRQNFIDQSNAFLSSQDIRINSNNLCGGWDLSLFSNHHICAFGKIVEQEYYITWNYDRVRNTAQQTLSDAYTISLGVSWFQQLLGQRLAPYFDTSKPLVRQYKYMTNSNNYSITYCPDIFCTENQNESQLIYTNYETYEYLSDQYLLQTGTNNWFARSWGYVNLREIWWSYLANNAHLFIDNFTTTGWLSIGNLPSLPNILNTIQLQFLVGEAPSWSSLSFDSRISNWLDSISWQGCNTDSQDPNVNRWCFYNNIPIYYDTYSSTWGTEGDIVIWEDNTTGIILTMGSREPYDLIISKTISTGEALPGDSVDITTSVCNNSTGRSDISLSEDYLPNMVSFWQQTATLWTPYTINYVTNKIIWNAISLAFGECKSVTTTYTVQNFVNSWSILIFNSRAGSLGAVLSTNNIGSVQASVTWKVIAPAPIIYTPYGNKEIVSSTYFPGDEIIYRINYSNPGQLTGIMNLYDMYESGLIFSGIISSTQWLSISSHNLSTRIITWSGVVVEPYSSHSLELSFIISTGKNAFDAINNNYTYDMTFTPDSYIADIDKSNNNSNWRASYSLNTFRWYIQHDTNNDGILDSSDKPLSWLEVQLIESGAIIANTISNSSGGYLFTGMRPGIYTISYTIPVGYIYGNTLLWNLLWWALTTLWLNIIAQYNTYSVNSDGTVSLLRTSVQSDPPSGWGSIWSSHLWWSYCGNGKREWAEQCDGWSACTANCTLLTSTLPPFAPPCTWSLCFQNSTWDDNYLLTDNIVNKTPKTKNKYPLPHDNNSSTISISIPTQIKKLPHILPRTGAN
jgi:hypothetical protein